MVSSVSPVFSLINRIWVLLLLVLLALVTASYLDGGFPRRLILLFVGLPCVLGLLSPALAVAATLAIAPLAEGIAALVIYGDPSMDYKVGIFWVEPIFLGASAGILIRHAWRGNGGRPPMPAARFYVAVIACGLALPLMEYVLAWRGRFRYVLQLMWRSLPYMEQSQPEHVLRAGLLLLAAVLWLWLVRVAVRKPEEARIAWLGYLAGAFVAAAYGNWMWVHGEGSAQPRVESLLDDVNSYGSSLVLALFVAWAMLVSERSRTVKIFSGIVLVVTAWMLLLSGSRIALMAALAGSAAVALVWLGKKRVPIAVAAVILAVAVIMGGRSVGVRYLPQPASSVIGETTNPRFLLEHFRGNRQAVWSATARAFLEHPVFGIGPGLLYRSLGAYYRADDRGWRPVNENAHNYFLQLAAETGLLGLLGFMWLAWAALRPALADQGPNAFSRRVLAIGALGYLATGITGHPLLLSRQGIIFWGLVGLISVSFAPPEMTGSREPGRRARLSVWVVLPVLLVTLLWRSPSQTCPGRAETQAPLSWDFAIGFYGVEQSSKETWRWMREAGQLRLCNRSDEPLVADVTFTTASFAEPRRLEVYSQGRRLAEIMVSPEPTPLTLEGLRLVPGGTDLIFIPSPGPRHVDPILHNGDRRAVSLRFGDPAISVRSSR